jgi:hypothetical protein
MRHLLVANDSCRIGLRGFASELVKFPQFQRHCVVRGEKLTERSRALNHTAQTDLSGVIAKEYATWCCTPTFTRTSPYFTNAI